MLSEDVLPQRRRTLAGEEAIGARVRAPVKPAGGAVIRLHGSALAQTPRYFELPFVRVRGAGRFAVARDSD
jgi:hypothetical protein